jgi:hypothetical protein
MLKTVVSLGLLVLLFLGAREASRQGFFDFSTWGRQAAIRAGEVSRGGRGAYEWCLTQQKGAISQLENGHVLKCE